MGRSVLQTIFGVVCLIGLRKWIPSWGVSCRPIFDLAFDRFERGDLDSTMCHVVLLGLLSFGAGLESEPSICLRCVCVCLILDGRSSNRVRT